MITSQESCMSKLDWLQTSPASTRRERRKQEYQERILSAAIQLFESRGFDSVTLEEICQQADVSRPTFYKYYASKHELIQALGEKLWLSVAQELTIQQHEEDATPQSYIASFIQLIRHELDKYGNLERELIRQSMMIGPNDSSSVDMLKALTGLFYGIYEQGRGNDEISQRYPVDFLAEITMGHVSTIMMNWAIDDDYPVSIRLDQLADLIPRLLNL